MLVFPRYSVRGPRPRPVPLSGFGRLAGVGFPTLLCQGPASETSATLRLWKACWCWFPHATLSGSRVRDQCHSQALEGLLVLVFPRYSVRVPRPRPVSLSGFGRLAGIGLPTLLCEGPASETSVTFRLWKACWCWFPHATLSGASFLVRSWRGTTFVEKSLTKR